MLTQSNGRDRNRLDAAFNAKSGAIDVKRSVNILLCVAVAACTSFPEPVDVPQPGVAKATAIQTDPETGRQYVDISVLIYNVWGLPWPVQGNSPQSMTKIGEILGEMRIAGTEPDVVLLQEAFTMKSQPILELSGWPWPSQPR